MNFLARIVRFLFWVLIVSWSVALLRRLVAYMLRSANTSERSWDRANPAASSGDSVDGALTSRKLVRDPVCGMHIAENLAIPYRDGAELVHFCSETCRDQYAGAAKKRAASA